MTLDQAINKYVCKFKDFDRCDTKSSN